MILQALVEYYERLRENGMVSGEGWCRAGVSYGINLSVDGKITGIISLKHAETRGKKEVWVPTPMTVPEMVTRSSGISANFLCDNSKYILGIDADGTAPRVRECFLAARERHLSLLQRVKGEMAQAVRNFFESWEPEQARQCRAVSESWEDLTDGGNLVFCMSMEFAHEDADIKMAWEAAGEAPEDMQEGICLVTGKRGGIARIHKAIKGVQGAQSSGAPLVSFNAPAFESYGKEQSYNAPVGKYAQFAYTTALNYLLSQKKYTFHLGDSTVVFWAESGKMECQDAFFMSLEPKLDNQETLRGLFAHLEKHEPVGMDGIVLDPEQKFYILCLAPNAARLSVRFFYQNALGNILENLSRHYKRMEIVKPSWEKWEYLGIWRLLNETVNQKAKNKEAIPGMAAMVLQAVLAGTRYPACLYTDTLIRIRAEQGTITWGRAAIIKAYLIQNFKWEKGEEYMGLNEESQDCAYLLGRLFAVLESVQLDANPGINSTIRDRYFNSASTAPASVFPILLKLKNSHAKKLDREKAGTKIYYEKILTDIMGRLDGFPKHLTLEEQGKFDLGYYHQVQKKYEKKEEK